MRAVLLDTNAWLFMTGASSRLGPRARALLASDVEKVFSVVSAWEVVIKHRAGKLDLPSPAEAFVRSRIRLQALRVLPCDLEHTLGVASLPPIHADPFDRLLIAQAFVESLPILTSDAVLSRYGVETIDATA